MHEYLFTNLTSNISNWKKIDVFNSILTHISLASFIWDICKQRRPGSDANEMGVVWSGSPLFSDGMVH